MTTTDTTDTTDTPDGERRSRVQRSVIELADGSQHVVRITQPDRFRWDMTAPRKGWGKAGDVPFHADSFVTWAAAKREGVYSGSWDDWAGRNGEPGDLVEITHLDQTDDDVVRPTNRGAGPALS